MNLTLLSEISPDAPASTVRPISRVIVLSLLTVAIFLTVTYFISNAFKSFQRRSAQGLFARGDEALARGDGTEAVADFETALSYAPGDRSYVLKLAQALVRSGHAQQASAYLKTLRQEEPGDGLVNLELARIAAHGHDITAAMRYFHDAIYGAWQDNGEENRRKARLELIEFLLQQRANTEARAELIGLTSDLPHNAAAVAAVGGLFLAAQDNQSALKMYDEALKLGNTEKTTLIGAGTAAYRLGQYGAAEEYLRRALAAGATGADLQDMFKTAQNILALDPYAWGVRQAARAERALQAFKIAGARLQQCTASPPQTAVKSPLMQQWEETNRRITERKILRDPDFFDEAVGLTFQIEDAMHQCPNPTIKDNALLALAAERPDLRQ